MDPREFVGVPIGPPISCEMLKLPVTWLPVLAPVNEYTIVHTFGGAMLFVSVRLKVKLSPDWLTGCSWNSTLSVRLLAPPGGTGPWGDRNGRQ